MNTLTLPRLDDLHVHCRQGALAQQVARETWTGGAGRVLAMPNLNPPITTVAAACAYRDELQALAPGLVVLPTLYLSPAITPAVVAEAALAGVAGIKSYPRGVTTNSHHGIESYRGYDPVFAAMEQHGLVLNLHGEVPSDHARNICVLNAEEHFLVHLRELHAAFPRLKIVLEHVTTAAAVACVQELGPTVAATITAHHLELCVDDWAGRNHNFCKPVAKYPSDRAALRAAAIAGKAKFFLGSDSAPHPRSAKEAACGCAGVYTAPSLAAYLADTFDRLGALERLRDFSCTFGAQFYGLSPARGEIRLEKRPQTIAQQHGDIVPFRAGETLAWSLCEV